MGIVSLESELNTSPVTRFGWIKGDYGELARSLESKIPNLGDALTRARTWGMVDVVAEGGLYAGLMGMGYLMSQGRTLEGLGVAALSLAGRIAATGKVDRSIMSCFNNLGAYMDYETRRDLDVLRSHARKLPESTSRTMFDGLAAGFCAYVVAHNVVEQVNEGFALGKTAFTVLFGGLGALYVKDLISGGYSFKGILSDYKDREKRLSRS